MPTIENEYYQHLKRNPKEVSYEVFKSLDEERQIEIFSILDRIFNTKEIAEQWNVNTNKIYYFKRKFKDSLALHTDPLNIHTLNLVEERKTIKHEMDEKEKELQIYRDAIRCLNIEKAKETVLFRINGYYSNRDIIEKIKKTLTSMGFSEGKVEVTFEVSRK